MSAESMFLQMPVCEQCWIKDHASWEPESMDENGNILMKLVNVGVPVKINTKEAEVCSECGDITVAGIYEDKDPSVVFFSENAFGSEEE